MNNDLLTDGLSLFSPLSLLTQGLIIEYILVLEKTSVKSVHSLNINPQDLEELQLVTQKQVDGVIHSLNALPIRQSHKA